MSYKQFGVKYRITGLCTTIEDKPVKVASFVPPDGHLMAWNLG
jgi:hypothetical protein